MPIRDMRRKKQKMKNNRLVVGVFFGGKSGEHEISIESGISVIKHLDREKYIVIPIYIRKDNSIGSSEEVLKGKLEGYDVIFSEISIEKGKKNSFLDIFWLDGKEKRKFDFFLPVLHGPYGEDGTIQGLFEMACVPYWGCGVGGSSVGMDKVLMKYVFKGNNLPIVDFIDFDGVEFRENERKILNKIEEKLSYPLFIKPARMGSSVGISKVKKRDNLKEGIYEALKYDHKILVEKSVENVREIECSVLGNFNIRTSLPGEIISAKEFYDYEAKYGNLNSKLLIPAPLTEKQINTVRELAKKAFKAIDGKGFARVDFLIDINGNIFLNEINTIPGFTTISMFPKLWEHSEISYSKLLDEIIELGFEIFKERNR